MPPISSEPGSVNPDREPLLRRLRESAVQHGPVKIAVSSCLLGREVRYDGSHKKDAFITGALAECADFVPVCPEVEIGMGVPRPPIRLVGDPGRPRVLGVDDPSMDLTARLETFAAVRVGALDDISGCILKKGSPSCGMEGVKVYRASGEGSPTLDGRGIFARILLESRPLLPVEDEERLQSPDLRAGFVDRVLVYRQWQALQSSGLTAASLMALHGSLEGLITAHSRAAYRRLGSLLSGQPGGDPERIVAHYMAELMAALKR